MTVAFISVAAAFFGLVSEEVLIHSPGRHNTCLSACGYVHKVRQVVGSWVALAAAWAAALELRLG